MAELERFFADAPGQSLDADIEIDKGRGCVEERIVKVSADIDWLDGGHRFPGEYRFPKIAAIASIEAHPPENRNLRIPTQPACGAASTSLRARCAPPNSPAPCAATGASKTPCTGARRRPS
jgi:hypothetical protein